MKNYLMALVALVGLAGLAAANNISVTNIALTDQSIAAKTVNVVFDLRWDNSWRGSENWDAAWVFVKFRAPLSNNWEHARLSANSAEHIPSAGSTIDAVPGGLGVFVYRSSGHTGSVNYVRTTLRWNYGSNGYNFPKTVQVEVSVHAIEMVYVPQGHFYLGSGGGETGHFYQYTDGSQTTQPYLVISETNAITIGTASGNLCYVNAGVDVGDGVGTLSATFPKGYAAFYCMKYEFAQGQYVDFLNKLTRAQQNTRTASQVADYFAMSGAAGMTDRNGIRCPGVIPLAPTNIVFGCDGNQNKIPNETDDAMDRACNFLSWSDIIAYADWAGLRPMTELEFEKAGRGFGAPVTNEFAWGNTNYTYLTGWTGSDGTGTETPSPANANLLTAGYMGGPVRAGIFATASSSRAAAGASYWGIMELSGNAQELPVTVGHSIGRAFTGVHGDGMLTAAGQADAAAMNWPGTDSVGAGVRGSNWNGSELTARLSNRFRAAMPQPNRINQNGSRAVRTAP